MYFINKSYLSLRPLKALMRVMSSAYSIYPAFGSPFDSRVSFMSHRGIFSSI